MAKQTNAQALKAIVNSEGLKAVLLALANVEEKAGNGLIASLLGDCVNEIEEAYSKGRNYKGGNKL